MSVNYTSFKSLKIEHRPNGILVVTLDSPPANAISMEMHNDLMRIMQVVNHDDTVKVILLTGAGNRAFSAGGDIGVMKHQLEHPMEVVDGMFEAQQLIYSFLRLERPIIARVNGHAIGLGCSIALLCDIIIATETAKIADPHVNVGYVAADGGPVTWPLNIGFARAKQYLLTGDTLTGKEAAEIGLINKAVPADKLDEVAYGTAERLAGGATKAINWTKIAINMVQRRMVESAVEGMVGMELMSNFTGDHKEAVHAFLEKRQPKFTGR
jgi:enoyl-CoA hydratase